MSYYFRFRSRFIKMPSAQQKKRAEKKKQAERERMAKKNNKKETEEDDEAADVNDVTAQLDEVDIKELNQRGTAGVLASHELSADIHIHNFSMTFHGKVSQTKETFPFLPHFSTRVAKILGHPRKT